MIERHSSTWIDVSTWVSSQIARIALTLENPALTYEQTQFLRGQISSLREVLELAAEKPIPENTPQADEPAGY